MCRPRDSLDFPGEATDRLTSELLHAAGLGEGMRVLNLGDEAGDVARLAVRLVGPTGAVIGIGWSCQTVADLTLDEPVDALIGRISLVHLSDPAVIVRRMARFVKQGGIVAFQEIDFDGIGSEPVCAGLDRAVERVRQTLIRAGIDRRTGLRLGRIFQEAGLPAPRLTLGAQIAPAADSPLFDQIARITEALLPLMARTGVASADEVGIRTLADRLREEAVALDATIVSPSFIGAWTRTPTLNHFLR